MKTYEQILNDLQKIQDDLNLTGDAVELNKRIAAYVYYNFQIDVVSAVRERSLNTALLMNSKIAACMDNMYSVYRGKNPELVANIKFESNFGVDKFGLVYTSNTFKLYASEVYSFQPAISQDSVAGATKPTKIKLLVSSQDKLVYSFNDDKTLFKSTGWPYYIDIKLDTNVLASGLSENVFIYRKVDDPNLGTIKKEVKWTRIFTEHASSKESDELLFLLTIPDYGIRLYRKGGKLTESLLQNLFIEILPYTTIEGINLYDMKKINFSEGVLRSQNGKLPSELSDPNDTSELEQVVNVDDAGNLLNSGLDKNLYQMWLNPEIPRHEVQSLPYQANFSGYASPSMISNNDILFLFSEVFIDKILSCNFVANTTGDAIVIYYVPNGNADQITSTEKEAFLNRYDKYNLANSITSISEGNQVSIVVNVNYVADGTNDITSDVTAILNKYNNILGKVLKAKELEAQINKLNGVSYIESLTLEGVEGNSVELDKSEYFKLEVRLNQVVE